MIYMFSFNCPYRGFNESYIDPSQGYTQEYSKAIEKLKVLMDESLESAGFPQECYEDGYGVDIYPENDEVCKNLEEQAWAFKDPAKISEHLKFLDAEIEKHRIKDVSTLFKHLRNFGEPPEYFYGLVKVESF